MLNFQCTDVFYANYRSTEKMVINQGGTSCFYGDQLVITKRGNIKIKDIILGDIVLSYNEKTKQKEWKVVKNLFSYFNSKKTVKIKLKDGSEIIATDDHKFFHEGGWYSLKHLLSLKYGNMETNTKL